MRSHDISPPVVPRPADKSVHKSVGSGEIRPRQRIVIFGEDSSPVALHGARRSSFPCNEQLVLARSDSYTPDLTHLLANECNRTFVQTADWVHPRRLFRQQIQPIAPRRNHGSYMSPICTSNRRDMWRAWRRVRRRSQRVMGRRDATAERAVTKKKRAQRRARV